MSFQRSMILVAVAGVALLALPQAAPAQCGAGSLTTTFLDNNGQSGNMFDITPAVDITIGCVDVNSRAVAGAVTSFDFYYRVGTSFGFESDPTAWTLVGNYTGTSAGRSNPTNVSLAGNGITFLAGQTYGIYFDAAASGGLAYTNGGPNNYSNADLTITTNCGKAAAFGSTFFPREWNGTVYYDVVGGGFSLSLTNSCPGAGPATASVSGATANGSVAFAYAFATAPGAFVYNGQPCNGIVLDLVNPILAAVVQADGSGNASVNNPNVPGGACGNLWVQAVDISSCTASNVASYP